MVVTDTCPHCGSGAVVEQADGALRCSACGVRFDPRQADTRAGGQADPAQQPGSWQPTPGQRCDGYLLEELIGSGGMSTVWAARQERLGRPVAVKILHAHLADDDDLRRRFLREAEALIQLDHPAIVPVIDQGETHGRPYLVMGLAGSHNLRHEIDRAATGRLPPQRVAAIARQLLAGLEHAHRRELIHRDIKPENVIVGTDGAVRLADFGIARLGRSLDGHTLTQLTRTDMVVGTVAYMAPEQTESPLQVDARTDLYCLGVVLYECLTGHRPLGRFEDPAQALRDDPAGPAWNAFLLALLERDPARRPRDANGGRALLVAVERAMHRPTAAPPPPPERAPDTRSSTQRASPAAAPDHRRRLLRVPDAGLFGGVAAGLAAWTGIHAVWVRIGLVVASVVTGFVPVLIGYVAAVVLIPPCPDPIYRPRPLNAVLPERRDGWWLGICDLLGRRTTMPAPVWRLICLLTFPVAIVPYIILGALLPTAQSSGPPMPAAVRENTLAEAGNLPQPIPTRTASRFWGAVAVVTGAFALTLSNRPWSDDGAAWIATTITVAWAVALSALLSALLAGLRPGDRPRSGFGGGLILGAGMTMLGTIVLALHPPPGMAPSLPADLTFAASVVAALGLGWALVLRRYAAVTVAIAPLLGLGLPLLIYHLRQEPGAAALDVPPAILLAILSGSWLLVHVLIGTVGRAMGGASERSAGFSLAGTVLGVGLLAALLLLALGASPAPLRSLQRLMDPTPTPTPAEQLELRQHSATGQPAHQLSLACASARRQRVIGSPARPVAPWRTPTMHPGGFAPCWN